MDKNKNEIVNKYNSFIESMERYRDYLSSSLSDALRRFETYIYSLQMNEDKLNPVQSNEVNIFNAILDNNRSVGKKNQKTLIRKKDVSVAGYANIFLVMLLTVFVGITVAGILYILY